jgi:HK97 family phage portal protein
MSFFDFLTRKKKEVITKEERGIALSLGYNSLTSYATTQATRLSAVYAATNMISNSCALLPMKIICYKGGKKREVEHGLTRLLNLTPNTKLNHFNWMKLMIESLILKGNAYAYIVRDENLNVQSLELIDPDLVTPLMQPDGSMKYVVNGMSSAIDAINMIHLYQHLDNTGRGISTIKYADMALNASYNAEKHSDDFFKSGAGLMGILKASSPLTSDQKRQIVESWAASIDNTRGGGVAVLPSGIDFQSISISPEDSQLLDVRKYNVIEIARFFNISPVKLFDYSNVSYSTLEQTSLSYLQDTILPYTQLMEDEFNRKLFKPSEVGKYAVDFDYSVLVQTDKTTEAEYYNKLITNGILSINDVRNKLGYEPIPDEDGGNAHFIQISYGTIKNVVDGVYVKQTAQDQNQKNDNKVLIDDEQNKKENIEKNE